MNARSDVWGKSYLADLNKPGIRHLIAMKSGCYASAKRYSTRVGASDTSTPKMNLKMATVTSVLPISAGYRQAIATRQWSHLHNPGRLKAYTTEPENVGPLKRCRAAKLPPVISKFCNASATGQPVPEVRDSLRTQGR